MGLTLVALGTGDAFSAERYTSCHAVGAGGTWLLLDCPHPIRKILREGSARAGVALDVGDVEAVALTHLHADHASGLEGLGYFSHFALGRRARLAAHPAVARDLWDAHLAAGMRSVRPPDGEAAERRLEDWFELVSLDERRPVRLGPFEIECRPTWHHVPTTALRVRAGGRSVAFSADTRFDRALVDWLAEADLVLHETGPGIHASYEALAALPAAVRAKMRLVHYPDGMQLAGGAIAPLVDGDRIDL